MSKDRFLDTVAESNFFWHGVADRFYERRDFPGTLEIMALEDITPDERQSLYYAYQEGWNFQEVMQLNEDELSIYWEESRFYKHMSKDSGNVE